MSHEGIWVEGRKLGEDKDLAGKLQEIAQGLHFLGRMDDFSLLCSLARIMKEKEIDDLEELEELLKKGENQEMKEHGL